MPPQSAKDAEVEGDRTHSNNFGAIMMLEWSIAPYGSSSSAADMSSNAVSSLDVSVTGHPAVRLSLNIADGFAPKRFVRLLSISGISDA